MFARLRMIFATWLTIEKEKQNEEQLKPVFLAEPRSILFFFQDHVPGIMLREFKVVLHVF